MNIIRQPCAGQVVLEREELSNVQGLHDHFVDLHARSTTSGGYGMATSSVAIPATSRSKGDHSAVHCRAAKSRISNWANIRLDSVLRPE